MCGVCYIQLVRVLHWIFAPLRWLLTALAVLVALALWALLAVHHAFWRTV